MTPLIGLVLYVGIAILVGFIGMMYIHAMQAQGKQTELEPVMVLFVSGVWWVTIPLVILFSIMWLTNLLAKKACVILIGKGEEV